MGKKEWMKKAAAAALGISMLSAGLFVPQTANAAQPDEFMIVKCQNTKGTDAGTETTRLRLITAVDSLDYKTVGFEVKSGDGKTVSYETTKVYTSVKAGDTKIQASDFSKGAAYLATYVIENVARADYENAIYVKPYTVTNDGTKVYGTDRYARVSNGYDGTFSVAVRVDEKTGIGAGRVFTGYDASKLEYVGYDAGTVFDDEPQVYDTGNQVRFINNVDDVTKDVAADGMLISLNFKVKKYDASNKNTYTFTVEKQDFCNVAEEDVTLQSLAVDSAVK